MNGNRLVDSNILIYLSKKILSLDDISDENILLSISVITYIEAMGYSFENAKEKKSIKSLCNDLQVIKLEDEIVSKTIELRQKHTIKLPDAIIAATALENDLELATRNTGDFKGIAGLKLFNPFEKK